MKQAVVAPEFESLADPVPVDGQRATDRFIVIVRIK
jgi:hypothetical protein